MNSIGVILVSFLVCGIAFSGCFEEQNIVPVTVTKTFKVLRTDAPDGVYWVRNYGEYSAGIFYASGSSDSQLKKTYTVQYMVGDELKTVLLDSTDVRVHVYLTDDNTSMDLKVDCTSYSGEDESSVEQKFFDNINNPPGRVQHINLYGKQQHVYNLAGHYYLYIFSLYIPSQDICIQSNETMIP